MHNSFECKMCGVCCYGEGGITVQDDEVERIASFLTINDEELVHNFCQKRNNKLYIKTGKNGACVFFKDGEGCDIQSVKPAVCYQWPFYSANMEDENNWRMAQEACPGINPNSHHRKFVEQGKLELKDYQFNGKWR